MRLEQSFEVPVPVAQAWSVLLDLERVAPCMPGATLTGFDGTSFTGMVTVKLGPISLSYRGQGRITEKDEVGHRLAFVAQGQDSRGAGGASARVSAVLHPADGGVATVVRVVTDLDISGKAAQYGRGMIAEVSGRLIKQFADSLAAAIGSSAPLPSTPPAPAYPPADLVPAPAVVAPIPTQAAPVDGVAPLTPPPVAPIFGEPPASTIPPPASTLPPAAPAFPPPPPGWAPAGPAVPATPESEPEYVPPTPAYSAPPEYQPLAQQQPDLATPEPSAVSAPQSADTSAPPPTSVEGTGLRQPPAAAEPLDLLAVSGAKGVLRRAAPVLIIVAVALAGLIVWLVAVK